MHIYCNTVDLPEHTPTRIFATLPDLSTIASAPEARLAALPILGPDPVRYEPPAELPPPAQSAMDAFARLPNLGLPPSPIRALMASRRGSTAEPIGSSPPRRRDISPSSSNVGTASLAGAPPHIIGQVRFNPEQPLARHWPTPYEVVWFTESGMTSSQTCSAHK